MIRLSSPPEAMRARARSSSPGLGEMRNSTTSRPVGIQVVVSEGSADGVSGVKSTLKRVFSMASCESSAATLF